MERTILKIERKVLEFSLNTIYCLDRIEEWLLASLEKEWNDKYAEARYSFEKRYVRKLHEYDEHFLLANCFYSVEGLKNKERYSEYVLRIIPIQNVSDDDYIKFVVSLFRIINDATRDETHKVKKGDFERFFFKKVEFGISIKVPGTLFEHKNLFTHPLACDYPHMIQTEAHFEVSLDSDFMEGLNLNLLYKREYDKEEGDICTQIAGIYKAFVLGFMSKKKFPINEQLCLVEDVTKELLARASALRTELEMKINKD